MGCYAEQAAITEANNHIIECNNNIKALTDMAENARNATENFTKSLENLNNAMDNCKNCMTMDGYQIDAKPGNPSITGIGNQIIEKTEWINQTKKMEETLKADIEAENSKLSEWQTKLEQAQTNLKNCEEIERQAALAAAAAEEAKNRN